MEASKDNLYEKLKGRVLEQEHSIETLTKESKRINTDNELLRAKVLELENSLNINRTSNYSYSYSYYQNIFIFIFYFLFYY